MPDQMKKDIWLFALSAHYVKKNGHTLVLYTDDLGERIFGYLPYDEIHRCLDELSVSDVFFSAGKIRALREEPVGSVHIDGDVFLKTPEVYGVIASSDHCDVVVQSDDVEIPRSFKLARPYLVKRYPWLFKHGRSSYQCGTLAFWNQKLRDHYINAYEEATAHLSRSKTLMTSMRYRRDCLSLGADLEQGMLYALAAEGGYRTYKMFGETRGGICGVHGDPYSHMYEHLVFNCKYWDNAFAQTKAVLKQENPQLYDQVSMHVRGVLQ